MKEQDQIKMLCMPVSELQRLLASNKKRINFLEDDYYQCDHFGGIDSDKDMKKIKKEIALLAKLQREIKTALRYKF